MNPLNPKNKHPTTIISNEIPIQTFLYFKKLILLNLFGLTSSFLETSGISSLLTLINNLILSLKKSVLTNNFNNVLVKNTIVNIVTITVIINIVANPLILDSPKLNIIIATINVVIFESIIALKLDLEPSLKALGRLFPFNNSSFILANVITLESTAIPIPRTNAAIPGRVSTPPTTQNTPNTKNV